MHSENSRSMGCSFTGHRELGRIDYERLHGIIDRAIAYAYENGCRIFYDGGALGFDLEAAERVILFRRSHPDVRLILLLPCPEQAEHWSASQKFRYENILRSADEVFYIDNHYSAGCMQRRNAELVRRADMLVAYLSHGRSGAGQTVAMAKRKGIPVFNLYGKE